MRDFVAFLRTYLLAEAAIILAVVVFILDQLGRVQEMSTLPHWAWQIGSAVLFVGAVVSILYNQYRRIESFKPGPPPPAADTATALLVDMLAQLMYVRDTRQSFDLLAAAADEKWNAFLALVAAKKPELPTVPLSPWKMAYNGWLMEVRKMQKHAYDSMGFKREFLDSINFQKNPGITVPNEQNFGTEADKYDLRRSYDEHKSCLNAIQQFRTVLLAKENTRKTAIHNAAKPSVADKPQAS
jgi:hypothetical protein